MATLILAAAGKALGAAALGGFGAIFGHAAGALAGSLVDQRLFGASRTVEGRRLDDLSVQSSTEGASLPRVYGRVRIAGQIIWATRFEEEVREESAGGKGGGGGGTRVRSYAYFASFAVALAEGPVARIGAVWADGKPMDLDGVTWRVHLGTSDQLPDPLVTARQGEAPAYRGTAYVVFERLPLAAFGDRLPQLTFEVIRPVEPLEEMVRAVTVIPGAGEFVYHTRPVTWTVRPGVSETANRQVSHAPSNFTAAMDELQALCPNLEQVALVVGWFGDNLDCSACTIRPKVESLGRQTAGAQWAVSGLNAASAQEVTRHEGRPAYGGTPSDESVLAAIAEIRSRGLKVALYPFLLMDVPEDNELSDPYSLAIGQPPYPWRGRITASRAPGVLGSPDGSASVTVEVSTFLGTCLPAHFAASGTGVHYSGPAEWSYRRFILHHARLAQAAGGVDAFLLGSEMRGLTRLYDETAAAPFVAGLKQLAGEVRAMLPLAAITYAADWSEYGAHQRGSGELRFPLDPLWADPDIDAVGIDAYFPLADQREDGDPDGNANPYALAPLAGAVAGGEDFDWYYASEEDRLAGLRSPITDGAHEKPFVYRAKDLAGWWGNAHVERVGGVEVGAPSPWVPASKPVWLTELGVPAVTCGANEPNVFVDAKSSESRLPRFSDGARDDLVQRRALEAVLGYWSGDHPDLEPGENPVSPVYGGPMLDPARIHLWAWDARPFPAFPTHEDLWADGANWHRGHWLNGRLGGVSLAGLIAALTGDFGLPEGVLDCAEIAGTLDGIALGGPLTLRAVLEPLLAAHGVVAVDRGTAVALRPAWSEPVADLDADTIAVSASDQAAVSIRRAQEADLPAEVRIGVRDVMRDHRRTLAAARLSTPLAGNRVEELDLGASLDPTLAATLADRLLLRRWNEREEVGFELPAGRLELEAGDVLRLLSDGRIGGEGECFCRIESIEDGETRRIAGRLLRRPVPVAARGGGGGARPRAVTGATGAPDAILLDLPPLPGLENPERPRLAAFASPWPGAFQIYRAREGGGLSALALAESPAILGTLSAPLAAGPAMVWDRGGRLSVEISGGVLSSAAETDVLAGANALCLVAPDGTTEIVQFAHALLTGPRRYDLTMLLRGLGGTEAAAAHETPAGTRMVLLDQSLVALPLALDEIGAAFAHALVPAGTRLDSPARFDIAHVASARGLLPFAPVHLRLARTPSGDLAFSWIRRTRIGGDAWRESEVPLSEDREAYLAELLDDGGEVRLSRETTAPALEVGMSEVLAAFGASPAQVRLRVRQVSGTVGPGLPGEASFTL
jgi:hypothetical protein